MFRTIEGPSDAPRASRLDLRKKLLVAAGLSRVSDPPDRIRSVVTNEKRAVIGNGDPDRATPDLAIRRDKAGEEVLILAGSLAMIHGDANDLISGEFVAVPGAVFGGKNLTPIFRRKLGPFVK